MKTTELKKGDKLIKTDIGGTKLDCTVTRVWPGEGVEVTYVGARGQRWITVHGATLDSSWTKRPL